MAAPSSSTPPALPAAELDDNPRRQKILICGERRSGKTSLVKVLFHDMSPRDTFRFIPPTHETRVENVDVFAPFQIWDVPGSRELKMSSDELKKFAAMIWVVDAINNYDDLFEQIAAAFCVAYEANPNIKLFVFVHKADGLTHDAAQDAFKDLQTEISNEIPYHMPSNAHPDDIPTPSFHLSSIYDYRLPLAFSQVILRILPTAPYLAGLMDSFVTASSVFKTFLVAKKTRLYVATDTAPVQDSIFNVLQEWLKKLNTFEALFEGVLSHQAQEPSAKSLADNLFPLPPSDEPTEPTEDDLEPLSSDDEDDNEDDEGEEGGERPVGHGKGNGNRVPAQEVHLSSGLTLVYWEMTPQLGLIGIIRTEHYRSYRDRIDEGVDAVRTAVKQYLALASGRTVGNGVVNGV